MMAMLTWTAARTTQHSRQYGDALLRENAWNEFEMLAAL
jgi:hypothetical protein